MCHLVGLLERLPPPNFYACAYCGCTVRGPTKWHIWNIFSFFLSSIQRSLSNTYPAPISTMFEITGVNRCAGACTNEKFPNFAYGFCRNPKKLPQKLYFGWGACCQHTAQTAQFRAIEIISRASWHPKDVPFVRELWWGDVQFGCYDPRRSALNHKHNTMLTDFRK